MLDLKGRKIVVLTSSVKTVRPVLLQLWEHGVEFLVTTTVLEVIKSVAEIKPNIVMLAFDHPKYNNVVVLSELLRRNSNLEIIGFVENESFSMLNRLAESGLKYTLKPPITAPFISRILTKVIKENPVKFSPTKNQPPPTPLLDKIAIEKKSEPKVKKFEIEPLDSSLQQAIDDQCSLSADHEVKSLKAIVQFQCCPVVCPTEPQLNGYLIAANASGGINVSFNNTLLKSVADLTVHWMNIKNLPLAMGSWFTVPCEEVEFTSWALSESKLYKSCFHKNEEIGFAFFSNPLAGKRLRDSQRPEFSLAPLAAFEAGVHLPFDVYLDVNPTEKLNLLGKTGDTIRRQQLTTLKKANQQTVLIPKEKESEFAGFAAECFFKHSVDGYNYQMMNQEMKSIMAASQDSHRMKNELLSARRLQDLLSPEPHYLNEEIEIRGFSQPASETGGDWWHYKHLGNKIYLIIGDATGHGVSAALVTSAANAASAIIKRFPDLPLDQLMGMLNDAIHAGGGGQVLMTLFLASIDLKNGDMKYANASHVSPAIFSNLKPVHTMNSLKFLDENSGPRLGESTQSQYAIFDTKLAPGDRVVFYTDGLTELENPDGDVLGEKKFLQSLIKAINDNGGISAPMQALHRNIEQFRKSRPYVDDVTFFMVQYKPAARRVTT